MCQLTSRVLFLTTLISEIRTCLTQRPNVGGPPRYDFMVFLASIKFNNKILGDHFMPRKAFFTSGEEFLSQKIMFSGRQIYVSKNYVVHRDANL